MSDDRVMVYDGTERTLAESQSPLQLFKGPEALIRNRALQDGTLYFATDTKKIYLDCDFTDSLMNILHDRIAFGGSTGIYYANKVFQSSDIDLALFIFTEEDFETIGEVPMIDDLILNEGDGSFYRVTSVDDYSVGQNKSFELVADRLTVSGSGGGGGGGGGSTYGAQVKVVGGRVKYFSREATYMPIAFSMKLDDPEETIGYRLYIGQNSTVVRRTAGGLPQSTEENPTIINIADFLNLIEVNTATEISVMPFGEDGTEVSRALKYTVTTFGLSLEAYKDSLNARIPNAINENIFVVPKFGTQLENVTLISEIIDSRGNELFYNEKVLNAADNNNRNTIVPIEEQSPGTYHILAQLRASIPGTNGAQVIYSNIVDQLCSWLSASQDVPVLSVSFPTAPEDGYKQYDSVSIPFTVYYIEQSITIRKQIIFTSTLGEVEVIDIDTETVPTGSPVKPAWSYQFLQPGSYRFRIIVGDDATSDTSGTYVISGVSGNVPVILKDSLRLCLTPDKTNNSANRKIWQSTGTATYTNKDGEVVPCDVSFDGVNWVSNGWGRDENNVPILHLDNGATMIVNGFSPFAANANNQGAEANGCTIEMDIKISNIKDRDQRLFTCISETADHDINVGIVANGDFIALNSNKHTTTKTWEGNGEAQYDDVSNKQVRALADNQTGLAAWYNEGERIRVTYVITMAGEGVTTGNMPKGVIYTYINGVISGLVTQVADETFKDGASATVASRFKFDSTYADIDIYGLRVYDTALDDRSVLINYLATIGDTQKSLDEFNDNDLLDPSTNEVSLARVIANGKIPYLVLRGGRQCDKNISEFEGNGSEKEVDLPSGNNPDADDHSNGKKDFRFMEAYFYNPIAKEIIENGQIVGYEPYALGSEEERELVTVYAQGTSSLQYPVKNLRLKFWTKNNDESLDNPGHAAVDKYTPYFDGSGKPKKKKVKVYPDQPVGAAVYTAKADYMDSSSAHNTGTANALPSLYGGHKTLAQYINDKYLTAIQGVPMVIFWKRFRHTTNISSEDNTTIRNDTSIKNNGVRPVTEANDKYSDYEYIGRYNFDLDKSEAELFGFKKNKDTNFGIRNTNTNIYETMANASSIATAFSNLTPSTESFRALIDDDADLTYDPHKTYYLAPSLTAEHWESPLVDNNGAELSQKTLDTNLKNQLKNGPLYLYDTGKVNSIECWELLSNNPSNSLQLQFFGTHWDETVDPTFKSWTACFESRYPEYTSEKATDKRSFARLINWLADCNAAAVGHEPTSTDEIDEWAADESLIPEGLTPLFPDPEHPNLPLKENGVYKGVKNCVLYQESSKNQRWNNIAYADYVKGVRDTSQDTAIITCYYDSFEYRLHKFKSEISQYMKIDMVLIYYILTEFLIAKDSRAKNMMLCCFDANPELNIGHWFPIFYDIDTILGIDNIGKLRYRYDDEDYDLGVFNTNADYFDSDGVTPVENYSVLWSNIRRTMYEEIASLYRDMRGKWFNFNNLIDTYNKNLADVWNPTLINNDVKYKFVRFLTGYIPGHIYEDIPGSTQPSVITHTSTDNLSSEGWLPAVQGTRSLHRRSLIKRRLGFLDGKYTYTSGGIALTYRIQKGSGSDDGFTPLSLWDITAHDSCYLSAHTSNGMTLGPYKFHENSRMVIDTGSFDGPEQEGDFYFFNQITDSHDLSGKRFSLLSIGSNPNYPSRLMNLDLTHSRSNYASTFYSSTNTLTKITGLDSLSYLEKINVSYFPYLTALNLSKNLYIQEVKTTGSAVSSITFPEGGVLKTIEASKAMTALKIKGHHFLTNLTIETDDPNGRYMALRILDIEDCPGVNTKAIFDKMTGTVEEFEIHLPDINWEFDWNEVVTDNERMVTSIPLLDKLIRASGTTSSTDGQGNLVENRTYVAGTITINNNEAGHEFGVDENDLYDMYGKYYPNIRFKFSHNAYSTTAYTFNAYSATGAIVAQRKLRQAALNELTFGDIFNDSLPIQVRDPEPKWTFRFVGWNIVGNTVVKEDDEDHHYTPEDAEAASRVSMVAHYVQGEGYEPSAIAFTPNELFDEETREFNIYPTFIGDVRSFTVTFYDEEEDQNPNVYETQIVRYGEAATAPAVDPVRVIFGTDVTDTRIYALDHYSRNFNNITSDNIRVYPKFTTNYIRAQDYVAPAEAFEILNMDINEVVDTNAPTTTPSENVIHGLAVAIKNEYTNQFITIPSSIIVNGYARSIASIKNNSGTIKRVYFEEGNNIRIIEAGAFSGSSGLEFVDLGACTNLYRIGKPNLADVVWELGGAFAQCPNLTIKEIPNSTAIIGAFSFYNQLTDHQQKMQINSLPTNLRLLGAYAFYNCNTITRIAVSDTLTNIPMYCFSGCTNMTFSNGYHFEGVQSIDTYAFDRCYSLNPFDVKDDNGSYVYSQTLKSIGSYAFQFCDSINIIVLYRWSVKEIGSYAFSCGEFLPESRKVPTTIIYAFGTADVSSLATDLIKYGSKVFNGRTLVRTTTDGSTTSTSADKLEIRLRWDTHKYDVPIDMFGDMTFAEYNFGNSNTLYHGHPVYESYDSNRDVKGGIDLFIPAEFWGSYNASYTQDIDNLATNIPWFSSGNPWYTLIMDLIAQNKIRIWYTRPNNEYRAWSNLTVWKD